MIENTELGGLFDQVTELVSQFTANHEKFVNKGNKSAGTRARVISGKITKLLKEYRAASKASGKE